MLPSAPKHVCLNHLPENITDFILSFVFELRLLSHACGSPAREDKDLGFPHSEPAAADHHRHHHLTKHTDLEERIKLNDHFLIHSVEDPVVLIQKSQEMQVER